MFFWIRTHQRGPSLHIPVNTVEPANAESTPSPEAPFKRESEKIIFSKHALCRMACRHIGEDEVKEILKTGEVNYSKIREDGQGKTIPLEGVTHDKQHVRIIFAPYPDKLVVVTVMDLDTEWQCNCN